jgi:cell division protein FtsB
MSVDDCNYVNKITRRVMKLLNKATLAGAVLGLALGAQTMVASAAPELTIQSEQAAHPRLHDAIHKMEAALRDLEAAPDDFGGNKAAAIRDTRAAIHSLKRALYYRLRMDDAAIDRAQ